MKIVMGADHGGVAIKDAVCSALRARGWTIEDLGSHGPKSVDYPDFARAVATHVAEGRADQGVLVCTTGIGMSIAANRHPGVRAALCLTPAMAEKARAHNDANVLVLGGALLTPEEALRVLDAWVHTPFSDEERHRRRVTKLADVGHDGLEAVRLADPETYAAIHHETTRQAETFGLIASENHVSQAVLQAQGSVFTNKYAEGYPGKRWYNGCGPSDEIEQLAIDRAKALFGADHVNVQPHSGSSANLAVFLALLQPGDTIFAMSLSHGGHLTHGHELNQSGRLYKITSYGVSRETEYLDYDAIAAEAEAARPKLIIVGGSSYPRGLDFARFRQIADRVGALLLVDMAHIAGLVAGGAHASPFPYADVVTTTTHKTLRGPRSGMILCRAAHAVEIDKLVFPGTQGGPLMHTIAAKAVCFQEALQPSFKDYARQIVKNAQAMAATLVARGHRLVSGGTDNHLFLVDVGAHGLSGKEAAAALERAGIVLNKNVIPFDTKSPFVTSGIRVGTPGITTRGLGEAESQQLGEWIAEVLDHPADDALTTRVRQAVREMARRFPIP